MKKFAKMTLVAVAFLTLSLTPLFAAESQYRFKIHNTTGSKITKVLVSEDGETFGRFDIGSGIPAGAVAELVWDSSTDDESCNQYFKATFANGAESEAVQFDFCEEGLTLEF